MRLVIIGFLSLLVSACWDQDEIISIESGGNMKWLVVANPDWDLVSSEGAKADLDHYINQMKKSGWTITTQSPVIKDKDIVVGLRGNLRKVAKVTDFYMIQSVSPTEVKIEFLCPIVDDYRVNRTIKFKSGNLEPIGCGAGVQRFRFNS